MSEAAHLADNARKQAKHRAGVKAELREIRHQLQDLHEIRSAVEDLRQAVLVRKSLSKDHVNAD
jgi:hypothetical protein